MAKVKSSTPKPIRRQVVEAQIDLLIDMLNQMDGDADMEPSLGFTTGGYMPELHKQDGPGFHMNESRGLDLEDEHDGAEPDDDGEPSLGWTDSPNQASASWRANHLGTVDLEADVGPIRKPRRKSKTGGAVYRGCRVLGVPPKVEPEKQTVLRVRRKGAAR